MAHMRCNMVSISLEAQDGCRVCRESGTNSMLAVRLIALSSQNMHFGIGIDITVCLLAPIHPSGAANWIAGTAENGISKWQKHYSPELYREPWYC